MSADMIEAIVHATLHTKLEGASHWSRRSMAISEGVSATTVQRIRDPHGLQPQRIETFSSRAIPGSSRSSLTSSACT
jgi:hypothetical protein